MGRRISFVLECEQQGCLGMSRVITAVLAFLNNICSHIKEEKG